MTEPIKLIPPIKPIAPIKPVAPVKPLPPLPKPETVRLLQVQRKQAPAWISQKVSIHDSIKPAELHDDYVIPQVTNDKEKV